MTFAAVITVRCLSIVCAADSKTARLSPGAIPLSGSLSSKGTPFEAAMIKNGIDPLAVEGSSNIPYRIENFSCDLHLTDVGVPTLSWRSVGHAHSGYPVECFIDELLQTAGKDPEAGRLEMMEQNSQHAGALRAVADLAKWSGPSPKDGRARGVAVGVAVWRYNPPVAANSIGGRGGARGA